ncbi:hypothetical protein Fmac_032451 [Flemingia macrophylla]|uniref:Uncharacterized protein n=1 Tax=Flemingia macrophylla TaxID=520843 RepID=A0ABD1L6B0_9FABA
MEVVVLAEEGHVVDTSHFNVKIQGLQNPREFLNDAIKEVTMDEIKENANNSNNHKTSPIRINIQHHQGRPRSIKKKVKYLFLCSSNLKSLKRLLYNLIYNSYLPKLSSLDYVTNVDLFCLYYLRFGKKINLLDLIYHYWKTCMTQKDKARKSPIPYGMLFMLILKRKNMDISNYVVSPDGAKVDVPTFIKMRLTLFATPTKVKNEKDEKKGKAPAPSSTKRTPLTRGSCSIITINEPIDIVDLSKGSSKSSLDDDDDDVPLI